MADEGQGSAKGRKRREGPGNGAGPRAVLKAKLVPIDRLRPDARQVREHGERSLAGLSASLSRFGQVKPVVVNPEGEIKDGNGTWLAAKRLGWTHINAIESQLPPEELARYAIAANRLGELSYFDEKLLALQLEPQDEAALIAMGFDQAEVEAVLAQLAEPASDNGERKGPSVALMTGKLTVRILVAVSSVEVIERALAATGELSRDAALERICQAYLDANPEAAMIRDTEGQLDIL